MRFTVWGMGMSGHRLPTGLRVAVRMMFGFSAFCGVINLFHIVGPSGWLWMDQDRLVLLAVLTLVLFGVGVSIMVANWVVFED